jgi:hypothetical protein
MSPWVWSATSRSAIEGFSPPGQDAYPTLAEKAAALMHSLARNQALVVAAAGG